MKYIPRPYQNKTTEMILNTKRCLIVLEMGLGKTVATLTAIEDLMCNKFSIRKTLIIAPKRVAQITWPEEIKKWDHLKFLSVADLTVSALARQGRLQDLCMHNIFIINIDNIVWLINWIRDHRLNRWPFDMVVIDESSTIKNPTSERFKALKRIVNATERMVLLSGTPTPNGLQDIWSQIYLIDGGKRLGKNITAFRQRYMIQNPYIHSWKMKGGVENEIYDSISDVSYVLRAKGNLDIPDIIYNEISIELTKEGRKFYDEMESNYLTTIDEDTITAGSAGVLSGKLMQLANGFAYDGDKTLRIGDYCKADKLLEMLGSDEMNDKSVLVFYWFKEDLKIIQDTLHGLDVRVLQDEKDVFDWNQGRIQVLLAHPASTGHGLNLQFGGHIIIWYGLTWSLELYEQANARLHRSGQVYPTVVHHLIATDTIDEEIMKRLREKKVSQEDVKDAIIARRKKYEQTESN